MELGAADVRALVSPVAALNSLINLLINARDAMPRGGRVKLITRVVASEQATGGVADQSQIIIEVVDTGLGMTPEVRDRAFDPLYSTKHNGNGLGLASVLEFVTDAGGSTSVVSSPGAGTTVSLKLPCIARHEDGRANELAVGGEPDADQGLSGFKTAPEILVVEDEPFALEALCELLGGAGFNVIGVGSSTAALEELRRNSFKVLLSDIVLSEESGAELARQALSLIPSIKVILMSGYVPQNEELDSDWLFLRKPIDTQVVNELLRSATRT